MINRQRLAERARSASMAAAEREGLHALVATSYENVSFLAATSIMTQRSLPERLAAVIVSSSAAPALIVCGVEEAQAKGETDIREVVTYIEFAEHPVEVLSDALIRIGLGKKARVGVEKRSLTVENFERLAARLPDTSFVAVDSLFDRLRAIKDPEEISLLTMAARSTDAAIRDAFDQATVGVADRAMASALAGAVETHGADTLAFMAFGSGPTAGLTHPVPTERALASGDVVRCDVGGYFSGYYSDMARTAILGNGRGEVSDMYGRLWAARDAVIAKMRPGVKASEIFKACVDEFDRRGLRLNLPHIGHSIGLGLHERPMLSPYDDTVLQEGMVFAVEPAHRDGGAILHVEDLVVVGTSGCEVVSLTTDWSSLPSL